MTAPIRVAVVDDQQLVRDGLSSILAAEKDITVACEGANGQDLLDALDVGTEIDVVLLDLRMPVMNGIATMDAIALRPRRPRILVVTTFDRDDLVLDAIAAGADGYLLKRGNRHDLVRAVRTVAEGRSVLAPEVTQAVMARVRRQPGGTSEQLSDFHLTARETDVLGLVGRGLNNDEIAARLVLSVHTVKTHLTSVLAKTGSRDRLQAALLAIRAGLT
jgi:DNA-binding NarL/FixJ family response regulator